MFSTRNEEKELKACLTNAYILKQIRMDTCQTIPGVVEFNLQPIHWEKSSFGYGYEAATSTGGVYTAKGSGALFKPLHSVEECKKASTDAINGWKKCLLPESTPRPK